jgi:hypothetical protein
MGNIIVGGHHRSPPEKVGLGEPKFGVTFAPPSAEVLMAPPLQQCWQDCCANSIASALQVEIARRLEIEPFVVNLPSRRWIYWWLRRVSGDDGLDKGGQIWAAFEALADLGFPSEVDVPYEATDPAKRDAAPTLSDKRKASDQKLITGACRIGSTGNARVLSVKNAIAQGSLVVWGTRVNQAFCNLRATDVWPGMSGSDIGGHAMVLRKYDGDTFWSRSSWGIDYADQGDARVSANAVASDDASDFWIVSREAPAYSGTK